MCIMGQKSVRVNTKRTGEVLEGKIVTLQQIAEAAGVSRGTVDRALNNRGRIRPEVEERIKRIAREMGYQPLSLIHI